MVPFIAFAALSAGSKILQGRAARAESRAQARLDEYNARVLEQDAIATENKGRYDQMLHREYSDVVLSKLRATAGASGMVVDRGAPLRAFMDQAFNLDRDSIMMGQNTVQEASRLRSQAAGVRAGAQITLSRGRAAETSGYLAAATSLIKDYRTGKKEGIL